MPKEIEAIAQALKKAWSIKSSSLWQLDNPALGQCGVTALVAQNHLGGDVLKTKFGDLWHFYNLIDGQKIDFTESQFIAPITYDDIPSNRDEAFADTNAAQYSYLSNAVQTTLESDS